MLAAEAVIECPTCHAPYRIGSPPRAQIRCGVCHTVIQMRADVTSVDRVEHVVVLCGCGKRLRFPSSRIGKRGLCPGCKKVIEITAERSTILSAVADTPRRIRVTCSCGRLFLVSEKHADRRTRCPACHSELVIPPLRLPPLSNIQRPPAAAAGGKEQAASCWPPDAATDQKQFTMELQAIHQPFFGRSRRYEIRLSEDLIEIGDDGGKIELTCDRNQAARVLRLPKAVPGRILVTFPEGKKLKLAIKRQPEAVSKLARVRAWIAGLSDTAAERAVRKEVVAASASSPFEIRIASTGGQVR